MLRTNVRARTDLLRSRGSSSLRGGFVARVWVPRALAMRCLRRASIRRGDAEVERGLVRRCCRRGKRCAVRAGVGDVRVHQHACVRRRRRGGRRQGISEATHDARHTRNEKRETTLGAGRGAASDRNLDSNTHTDTHTHTHRERERATGRRADGARMRSLGGSSGGSGCGQRELGSKPRGQRRSGAERAGRWSKLVSYTVEVARCASIEPVCGPSVRLAAACGGRMGVLSSRWKESRGGGRRDGLVVGDWALHSPRPRV